MLMRFKIALRNIIRHTLRSLLSVSMIAGAVAAVILFQGFSTYSLYAIKTIAAENQYGNMQIAKETYWSPGKESKSDRMFSLSELEELESKFPVIEKVSGRASFFGLISNGDLSIAGKIIGVDTAKEPNFKLVMKILEGSFFSPDENEIVIGRLLAKQLHVKAGDELTVLTNTVDGVMNAMDVKIAGVFSAGLDEIDGQVIYMPLHLTQMILDTDLVDIAVVKFHKLEDSELNIDAINGDLKQKNQTLFAKSWRDLALFYRQVSNYFGVQNRLIESILLALMFLGILNTVSMTVIERTGEIGTLRSLGESRQETISQFLLESLIISVIGVVAGALLAKLGIIIIHTANIVTDMPGATTPFQIKIFFYYSSFFYAASLAIATAFIATLFPALRASRMNIVDALRKNI